MKSEKIRSYIVTGFMDAGKTTCIQDYIFRDYFHKREHGRPLIICFEEGDASYDERRLSEFRAEVEIWNGSEICGFLLSAIEKHHPDRIFVESNCMTEGLTEILFQSLHIVSTTLLIDAETLDLYYRNMLQLLQDMVKLADPVIFNRAEEKEELAPYATAFRLMNQRAGFLWESPMGYHEKVFGNALPFDRMQQHISLTDTDYPLFYLDALEYPEHYIGKELELDVQIDYGLQDDRDLTAIVIKESPAGSRIAKNVDQSIQDTASSFFAKPLTGQNGESYCAVGRTVMTCCMNDIQFLSFPLKSQA